MSAPAFPPVPPTLKAVQHYMKIASDYETREPVVTYWARLYSLQSALKLDRKSPEARLLLTALMDWLETFKKVNADNESVTSDIAGSASVENVAHSLFIWADGEDRASHFNKNVVKAFYSAGIMFDIMEVFGNLTDEIAAMRKYAKWKATYIHNCLKNGETPMPGPMRDGSDDGFEDDRGTDDREFGAGNFPTNSLGFNIPLPRNDENSFTQPNETSFPNVESSSPLKQFQPSNIGDFSSSQSSTYVQPSVPPNSFQPQGPPQSFQPQMPTGVAKLQPDQILQTQKYLKWAVSALDYQDTITAMENLKKAMKLLATGEDS